MGSTVKSCFPYCVLSAGLPAKNHFRVVNKVVVDGKTVCIFTELRPLRLCDAQWDCSRFCRNRMSDTTSVPALALNALFGKRIAPSSSARSAIYFLARSILAVHRVARGHKRDHAARTHLIERLGEKVIMDGKTELVVSSVVYLILSERHVADGKIIEISPVRRFKSGNGDIRLADRAAWQFVPVMLSSSTP